MCQPKINEYDDDDDDDDDAFNVSLQQIVDVNGR